MKTCTKCKKDKDVSDYYTNKGGKGGLRSQCKHCYNARVLGYKKVNADKCKDMDKKYTESEGICVYKATYPSGIYIGSGSTVRRRNGHLTGNSGIAKSLREKATKFEVLFKGNKEQCRLTEDQYIDKIGLDNLLNTRRASS